MAHEVDARRCNAAALGSCARAKGSGQSTLQQHPSGVNRLTGDARQNALLEEQVRRARSVDGRLSTYNQSRLGL